MLTYNLIQAAINAHHGRELFCLESAFFGPESPRAVFVSAEVWEVVNGPPWSQGREGRRFARLRALFDSFTNGEAFTVAENPCNKDARALLARVCPVEAEVWDFRCLDPRPGIRAFGRFSEPNVFIVLSWEFRENLDKSNGDDDFWRDEVQYCVNEWQRLFGTLPPHRGASLDEYVYNARSV